MFMSLEEFDVNVIREQMFFYCLEACGMYI